MSKFIKVVSWEGQQYRASYTKGKVIFLNTDTIKNFYRVDNAHDSFNFKNYFNDTSMSEIEHPTIFITKDGRKYYSPIDLNNSDKFEIEEIESRFDILDL